MRYEVARRVINKDTGSVGANHDDDGPSQESRPNRVTVVNNHGPGTQNNNEGGNQNNVTGGVSISGSTFNGTVQFWPDKDEFCGMITLLQTI